MGVKQENVDDEPIINNFQDPTKLNQHEGSATIKRDIKIVPVDKFQLVPEFLKVRGLVKQHLESYNYFVNIGIKKILRANDRIVSKIDPTIYLRFKDIRIGKPTVEYDSVRDDNTPYKSRQSDLTYAAPIYVNIEYITGSHVKKTRVEKNDVVIGEMPVMLRSCRCVLYQKNEAKLSRLGECPLDPGGYFIIKGTEKVLMIQEQLSDNRIIIDKDKKGRVTGLGCPTTPCFSGMLSYWEELQKLADLETHLSKCTKAREASDWARLLAKAGDAIQIGAGESPQFLMCRDEAHLKLGTHLSFNPNVVELFPSFSCRYVKYVFALIEWKNNRFETTVLYATKAEEIDPQNVEILALVKNANVEKALICGNNCLRSGRFLDAITL